MSKLSLNDNLAGQDAAAPANGQQPATKTGEASHKDLDSEREIVFSLAKLQELETKIHQLRPLVPDRLLAPIIPIVNPRKAGPGIPVPKSPQLLFEFLSQSARDGVMEVEAFKSLWQSPELKAVWDWMDEKLEESDGQYPQPTGMWERDYDVILRRLDEEERKKDEQRRKEEEQHERLQVLSTGGGWKGVVTSFQQRQLLGFQVAMSKNESLIIVHLGTAGMMFDVQEVANAEDSGTLEWQVATHPQMGRGTSRLEGSICTHLNTRPRKWDLAFLLEMIYSYCDVRRVPCKKCNMMTDNTAQLPVIRHPISVQSADGSRSISWEAYHPGCA